jgi:tyrosyl-tRNA synthetase
LDPNRTSPYRFYQFWYNTPDEDVEDYLKVFTLLTREEIGSLAEGSKANPAERQAQKRLAREMTGLVHGDEQAAKQEHIAQVLFGGGDISELQDNDLQTVRDEIASLKTQPGMPVIEALVKTGLAASNSEARRLSQNKAVYVNNQHFSKEHFDAADFKNGRLMLRRGKAFKDSALVELV